VWEAARGLLVFVVLVCVCVYFCCCSRGCLCYGCWGLGLGKVGIVGWSVGDECVGGRGSLVGRMGGEGEGRRRECMRRGRTSCWGEKQWILAQEKEGERRG
jgi:hypothetical protein